MAPQKYYAVQNGRETGVYNSWSDCQKATSGYSGAVFKSFGSYSDAQSFASSFSGYNTSGSSGSKSSGSRSGGSGYASSKSSGSRSGGSGYASSKSSGSRSGGSGYASSGYSGSRSGGSGYASSGYSSSSGTSGGYYDSSSDIGYTGSTFIPPKSSGKINKTSSSTATNNSYSGSKIKQTVVYTDGASSNNGYASARAGYGVFYGDNDHRNKSARLSTNEPQTNQRAELHAIVDALQTAVDTPNSDSKNIRVMTDSKYSRDCLTSWGDKWETNGYKSSTGKQVQNQDLIKNGRALMQQLKNQGGSIEIEHVKGHADNYGNNQADKLAVHGRNM